MTVASAYDPFDLPARLRRRSLRKLSAEVARLERAAHAARLDRDRLERARAARLAAAESGRADATRTSPRDRRADHILAAARRREEALQIALGDCRAQIFGQLVRGQSPPE